MTATSLQRLGKYEMKASKPAFRRRLLACIYGLFVAICFVPGVAAQEQAEEFGPVVRAYLGYLTNEQEVVDDRASRREVSAAYYRHNSNRIRALRQIAIRIARETQNDYLPELEAVSRAELRLLFEQPPKVENLRVDDVLSHTFRFLGTVRSGEIFYVFARLDPYEQAELREKDTKRITPTEPQGTGIKVSNRTGQATPP